MNRISKFLSTVFLLVILGMGYPSQSKPVNLSRSLDSILWMNDVHREMGSREMGEFVQDIKISPLDIEFPNITRTPLKDRGEILSMGDSFFPIVYLEIHFYAGEFSDIPSETPPLLFGAWELGGTKSYPNEKFMGRLEYLGVKLDWKSEYEKSVLEVSYLIRDEKEVLEMLQEWLKNPILTKKNIETVRNQLKEELLRRNDSVAKLGMRKAKELSYKNHLRGRSPSISSLESIKTSELEKFYKRLIASSKVNVLLTGNTNPADIEKWMGRIFQKFPKSLEPSPKDVEFPTWMGDFRSLETDVLIVDKETNQSMVTMTAAMPPHNHPDFYAIQVLNYILGGGGFNSYLMTEIRNNRGLAYSTTSHVSFLETHGLFFAYTLTKNESVPEVIDLMEEILSMDTIEKIKEEELVRAKNAIVNQFVFLFENKNKILTNQIRFDDHNMGKNYLKTFRDSIQKVDLADIKRVGEKYFQSKHRRITVAGPKDLAKNLKRKTKIIQAEDSIP